MNSSKREKTPWTKFRNKHGPKKKENDEYLFNESRRKELENKAYPSEFMAATMPFPFTAFPEAFLVVFPRVQWAIFVSGARGPKARVSLVGGLSQLNSALMRCDKL